MRNKKKPYTISTSSDGLTSITMAGLTELFKNRKTALSLHSSLQKQGTQIRRIMEIPKIKEDESLAMWEARLARELNLDCKMQEIIREVSVTSYVHGTNDIINTLKKEGRL